MEKKSVNNSKWICSILQTYCGFFFVLSLARAPLEDAFEFRWISVKYLSSSLLDCFFVFVAFFLFLSVFEFLIIFFYLYF